METAYDGRQVVGMDLHRRRSVLVRMTEDGRRLGTARITNSPAELRAQIAPLLADLQDLTMEIVQAAPTSAPRSPATAEASPRSKR
jgi:hypothetical protein